MANKIEDDLNRYGRYSEFRFVNRILDGKYKYEIDYYQREYEWHTEQIIQLIEDLKKAFENKSSKYYLGAFIARTIGGDYYSIVDGQQRLTSITLLLIFILNKTDNEAKKTEIRNSLKLDGETNWCFDDEYDSERKDVLKNLARKDKKDESYYQNESAKTMRKRFYDIENELNDFSQIDEFGKWIFDHVFFHFIEVRNPSDAYNLFVGRNDRGLPLSEIDLVKSYLLSNAKDDKDRDDLNRSWKKTFSDIKNVIKSEDEERFFVDFLRARYACDIRQGKKNSRDEDYEKIGNNLHKWVMEKSSCLFNPDSEDQIRKFINETNEFYAKQYRAIYKYKTELTRGFENVFYNNFIRMDYQSMVLRAALNPNDDKREIMKKIRIVSYFLDCFSASRIVNSKEFNWNSNKAYLFGFIKEVRNKNSLEIRDYCKKKIQEFPYKISNILTFSLNDHNGNKVKYRLSRLTSSISEQLRKGNQFCSYINTDKKQSTIFDIEHVLARNSWKSNDIPSKKSYGFQDEDDFNRCVNRIGNLILFDTKKNKSVSDKPVEEKILRYQGDNNPLRSSLCNSFYGNNPDFNNANKIYGYGFEPVTIMNKHEIEQRCGVYKKIAENIWRIERLDEIYSEDLED